MKKMYQVFVSSTYEDLIDERIKVLNALSVSSMEGEMRYEIQTK